MGSEGFSRFPSLHPLVSPDGFVPCRSSPPCKGTYMTDWVGRTVSVLPHPHSSFYNYFSISVQFFSDVAPIFLSAHNSPSNLAESRYEGPGLSIRDCTRGCHNCGQSRSIMSAIGETGNTFFERLYFVLGLRIIAP